MTKTCCSIRGYALLTLLSVCVSGAAHAQSSEPQLLRDPSLSDARIAFSYAGNIWVINHDGGNPQRLTAGGHEGKPIFSPDGTQIAFTGDYDGTPGVYTVPTTGGEPRRLTYHPADIGAVGWTPDGKAILFSSARAEFAGETPRLFVVPATGGFATDFPLLAAEISYSQDASRIAYVPNVQWPHAQDAWKRYRGGQTQPIWIAVLSNQSVEAKIPRDNSNDFNPMWVGDTIYFLSDRSGPVSLFAYDLKSRKVEQVVQNDGFDIKSAFASRDAIVFEQFGSLHLLDLKTRQNRLLDIHLVADLPEVRPYYRAIEPKLLRAADLSPTGARAVFGVRGEILTVPADNGDIRNLTNTTGVVERDPSWSPDGRSIAYFSDESGEYALHVRDQNGLGEPLKISFGKPSSFYYTPTWAPDSKKIGYTDKRLNYWYVDLEKKTPVRVDTDLYVDPAISLQLAWSPDSRWIAYTKQLPNHLHAVFVYSLEQGKSYQLTDGMSDVLYVAFDKAGQYLYFTASTDVALTRGWLDMSSFQHPVTRSVYAVVLKKEGPSPVPPRSDEERTREAKGGGRDKAIQAGSTRVDIDLDNIRHRIVALPVPARNYYGLLAGKPGVIFLLEGPPIDHLPFDFEVAMKVEKFDLNTAKTENTVDDVTCVHLMNGPNWPLFRLSFNGEKMLYVRHNQWFVAPTDKPVDAAEQAQQVNALKFDSMKIYVDPRAEWKHMYEQVWRDERNFVYDPGLHGLDLEIAKKKYEPFLHAIATRSDLKYLFEEMLGNIVIGHMSVGDGDSPEPKRVHTGLLGADYAIENGRYRFVRVYPGDTWDPALRAPLTQPGVDVQAGEYLLAVNGHEVRPPSDVYSFFEETAGKQLVLKVGPRSDGSGSREVAVVPLEDELPLRRFAWIEGNRRKVDELSGGRVAYVYMPNTAADGYTNFNRYFFAQVGKQALILDERYNQGGKVADYIIDVLRRPLLSYWNMREGQDMTTPLGAIFGPKVMVINERAGSGGDALPWMFRKAAVGPLVGKRTWGGLVGHYAAPDDLLDGGFVATPNLAFYNPNGTWDVENHGVAPDIEVDDDPRANNSGHDPQLEKAVEVAMELLKKNPPPPTPEHPPYPQYRR